MKLENIKDLFYVYLVNPQTDKVEKVSDYLNINGANKLTEKHYNKLVDLDVFELNKSEFFFTKLSPSGTNSHLPLAELDVQQVKRFFELPFITDLYGDPNYLMMLFEEGATHIPVSVINDKVLEELAIQLVEDEIAAEHNQK
ncbi:hypothetical protein L0991_03555 [Vibrio chagasii]|uniref:hypothetical protein n=1 Tax=Vibrio chagasii TaxID=170679 RepID=UPI0035A71E53